jgi:hypothetical protein
VAEIAPVASTCRPCNPGPEIYRARIPARYNFNTSGVPDPGRESPVGIEKLDANSLSGTWALDWGPVTMNVSESTIAGHWNQAVDKRGVIQSGNCDPATGGLTFTCCQHWNNLNLDNHGPVK